MNFLKIFNLFLFFLLISACSEDEYYGSIDQKESTVSISLDQIKNLGFDTVHAQVFYSGYIVEGEFYFSKNGEYKPKVNTSLKHFTYNGGTYTNPTLTSAVKIFISRSIPQGSSSWYSAISKSVSDWNGIGKTSLKFVIETDSTKADLWFRSDEGSGIQLRDQIALSNPDGQTPYEYYGVQFAVVESLNSNIKRSVFVNTKDNLSASGVVNTAMIISFERMVSIISHTIGHCVGFAHTNQMDYSTKIEPNTVCIDKYDASCQMSIMNWLGTNSEFFTSSDTSAIRLVYPLPTNPVYNTRVGRRVFFKHYSGQYLSAAKTPPYTISLSATAGLNETFVISASNISGYISSNYYFIENYSGGRFLSSNSSSIYAPLTIGCPYTYADQVFSIGSYNDVFIIQSAVTKKGWNVMNNLLYANQDYMSNSFKIIDSSF